MDKEQRKYFEEKIKEILNIDREETLPEHLERADKNIPDLRKWIKYE